MAGGVLTAQRPCDGQVPSLIKLPSLALPQTNQRVHYMSPYTSLPSLPDHGLSVKLRKLWGEDELTDRVLDVRGNALTKARTNFDNCNPDADVYNVFPRSRGKTLTVDDVKFPITPCVGRRVTRDPTFQIFPVNDPNRTTGNGDSVLSAPTRGALDKLCVRLYRTSRNSQIYYNKARTMKMRIERDGQFAEENLKHRIGICPRTANEGDRCSIPWPAPCGFAYGSSPQDKGAIDNHFKTTYGCSFCRSDKQNVDSETEKTVLGILLPDEKETVSDKTIVSNNCTMQNKRNSEDTFENLDQTEADNDSEDVTGVQNEVKIRPTMDDFGPWENSTKAEGDVVPGDEGAAMGVQDFKLPSSDHCSYLCSTHQGDLTPGKHDNTQNRDPDTGSDVDESKVRGLPNRWTNRDRNNLRRPCISKVIGMLNKSDAHMRYHLNHPDVIPDLRTFRRCLRRTQFFGYNSYVFRG